MIKLVAISASYGAGGSEIGPALAERLGVPFVDRAIPMAVAEQLEVDYADAAAHDQSFGGHSLIERIMSGFVGSDTVVPTPLPAETITSEDFRRATEAALLEQAATGEGVIVGRGAAILLREDPRALRVRLDGPVEARIAQAMRLGGIDRETAARTQHRLDRVHEEYVRHFYDVDVRDASLYHVSLDATALPVEAAVEVIFRAAETVGVPFDV
jgi:cytidylate kinase